jgi:hypothetical protein
MGKRNKKKRQQEEAERLAKEAAAQEAEAPAEPQPTEDVAPPEPAEEPVPEPVAETAPADAPAPEPIPDTPVESSPEEMLPEPSPPVEPVPIEEPAPEPEEERGEPAIEEDESPVSKPERKSQGFLGSKWMLIIGIGLVLAGILSVILMRTNYLQVYLLGWDEPYTGVGRLETPAQFGNTAFYAIGLVMIFVWGMRAPVPDEGGEVVAEREMKADIEPEAEVEPEAHVEPAPTVEEIPEPSPPAEFGHEHLPAAHLSPVEKIKHLTRAYSQGKISEGLYNENLAKFEMELEAKAAAPQPVALKKSTAKEEEYGHEHLPPAHLSPEDKIDHLTKAYAAGKISKGLYERDLARFEEEEKREQAHMPPHHLTVKEKMEHLENAYRQGRISKGTYDKNVVIFKSDIELDIMQALVMDESQPDEVIAPEAPETIGTPSQPSSTEADTMNQLDSLLDEIEKGNDNPEMREKLRKKKEESFEDKILQEIEDLEDL